MFIVLKEGRSKILRNDFETSKQKYIAHYYLGQKYLRKNIDILVLDLD